MEFTEEALMKLWKGLFFCMWMSDKPFVQQELANSIAGLVHCFARRDQSLMFMDAFFKTMAREWFAIDRFRLEKFMMLVRRCFRQGVAFSYRDAWCNENITAFCDMLQSTALCPNSEEIPLGLRLHVIDVFLQELARMHGGELTPEQATLFLQPFFDILMHSNDRTLLDAVRKNVFFLLLDLDREAAELGVDPSSVKIKGCNGTTGDNDSAEEEEEEDMYDEHGRVLEKGETCQDLPAIPFDYSMIAHRLFDMLKEAKLKPFNRGLITRMVKKFRAVIEEGLVRPPVEETIEEPITEDDIDAAASKLEEELEEELEEDRDEVLKLKKERNKGKPMFGFDSSSGAYEYIFNDSGDSEDDEGLGNKTGRNKKRPNEKHLKRKARVADSDEDTDSCDSDDNELHNAKIAGRKRKHSAGLPRNAEKGTSNECAAEGAESSLPPKKKQRKRKPRKPNNSLANADGTVQDGAKLNLLDNDTKASDGEPQKGSNLARKAVPVDKAKKAAFTSKKADQLTLGKAAQKESLCEEKPTGSVGGTAQQQRKMEKVLRRRQARKEKKERRLAALAKGFHVTPLPAKANEAKKANTPVTSTSLVTRAGKATDSTESSRLSLPRVDDVASVVPVKHQVVAGTEILPGTPPFKSVKNKVEGDSAKALRQTPQANGKVIGQAKSPSQGYTEVLTKPRSPGKSGTSVTKVPVSPLSKNLKAAKSPRLAVQNNAGAGASLQGLRLVGKGFTSTVSALQNGTEAKESSESASVEKLLCTPKASNPVAPAFRKSFTETKAKGAKFAKFSTPPAMLSSASQEEKRVIFALSKNKAQDPREYFETLKNSPQIPFDASKKPAQGVLKARLSLPSSAPVSSAKKRVRASDAFESSDSHLFRKKRPSASDFF